METVLIADDEAEMCAVAAEMLEGGGYVDLRAHDAGEALNIVEHHPWSIDLLLTDVVMPGMNGIVLAERVRLGHPDMKVLFMSAFTRDSLGDQSVLPAGVKLVVKPFPDQNSRSRSGNCLISAGPLLRGRVPRQVASNASRPPGGVVAVSVLAAHGPTPLDCRSGVLLAAGSPEPMVSLGGKERI